MYAWGWPWILWPLSWYENDNMIIILDFITRGKCVEQLSNCRFLIKDFSLLRYFCFCCCFCYNVVTQCHKRSNSWFTVTVPLGGLAVSIVLMHNWHFLLSLELPKSVRPLVHIPACALHFRYITASFWTFAVAVRFQSLSYSQFQRW